MSKINSQVSLSEFQIKLQESGCLIQSEGVPVGGTKRTLSAKRYRDDSPKVFFFEALADDDLVPTVWIERACKELALDPAYFE